MRSHRLIEVQCSVDEQWVWPIDTCSMGPGAVCGGEKGLCSGRGAMYLRDNRSFIFCFGSDPLVDNLEAKR